MDANRKKLEGRIDAAMGRSDCDLLLKGASYLDVFSCRWRQGDIAIADDCIVGVESGLKAKRTVDGKGKWCVPGFIDAHVHVESSMLLPRNFDGNVLPRGTTTAICDPHELTNVQGVRGLEYFLKEAESLRMTLRVMLSSCVPATDFETNGAGHVKAEKLVPLLQHPKALGLAEMMNVPGVLLKSDEVMEKLAAFQGRVLDGHCPLVTGRNLQAYAAAGISSCHESTRLAEAEEKLRLGIAVWIREGSVAKDLAALIPILDLATSTSVGFCTDDRNPLDIHREGHLDYMARRAIAAGKSPEIVYRAMSWTVARHYGLSRVGAVAPGYVADLVLLDDLNRCEVGDVVKSGKLVSDWEPLVAAPGKTESENSIRCEVPEARDLIGPAGRVHVIEVLPGKILTKRHVMDAASPGVARLTVLERYGKKSRPANAYVIGFGAKFSGAIASSVGHDSHNVIVVGTDTEDMRVAIKSLKEAGGGFFVVKGRNVLASLALPFGGLMTSASSEEVVKRLEALREASRSVGCELQEPFLQLAFLSLPVIPSLKLTDKGLVDVEKFEIIGVSAA